MITLTLEDIYKHRRLRELGALAGDQIVDGKLVRRYSSEDDKIDLGIEITQADIDRTPELSERGIEVGDKIVDGKFIKTNTADAFTQFKYGFDKTGNLLENINDVAIAKNLISGDQELPDYGTYRYGRTTSIPGLSLINTGFGRKTEDEIYGEGFSEASSEDRRLAILRKKERDLQEEFGPYFEPQDGIAQGTGAVAKVLADPTNLLPIGKTRLGMSAIGAGLGVTYGAAEEAIQNGEVDPWNMAMYATVGAVIPQGVVLAGKATKSGINKIKANNAEKTVDQAQRIIDARIKQGYNVDDVGQTLTEVGMNPAKVNKALADTARTLNVGTTKVEKAVTNSIVNENSFFSKFRGEIDKVGGILSTQIKKISVPIFGLVRRYEQQTAMKTTNALTKVKPWLEEFSALTPKAKNRIGIHLANGELEAAEGLMKANSETLHNNFVTTVRPVLDDLKEQLKDSGYVFSEIENYFPRLVSDYDGLLSSLGAQKKGVFDIALQTFATRKGKPVSKLTPSEKADILNMVISGRKQGGTKAKPRFLKSRKFDRINEDELQKFYASPEEALNSYITTAISNIEKRKVLFRQYAKFDDGRLDLEGSIGGLVNAEVQRLNLNSRQQTDLSDLLETRFIKGEAQLGSIANFIKDTGYLGTIANPLSALTQLTDNAVSVVLNGFRNTLGNMFSEKNMKLIDIGTENVITKELGGGKGTINDILFKAFKASGFSQIDKLGKETFINSALKRASADLNHSNPATRAKNLQKFRKEHGEIYGDEFDALVADLRAGEITDNTKLFAFNKLADVQPIALSEMPPYYLQGGNWRILYMLKSFMLKQIDIVRNQVVNKYANATSTAEKIEAIKTGASLGLALTISNTGVGVAKDILLGREVKPEDLPETAVWGLLGIYGLNQYSAERYLSPKNFDPVGFATNQVVPPFAIPKALYDGVKEFAKEDFEEKKPLKILKGVPPYGNMIYQMFGGGAEEYNERQRKERERKE